MKSIVSFLVFVVVCGVFFYLLDVGLMKTQGLQLIPEPEKTEAKASH
jgi:hypothetical protein